MSTQRAVVALVVAVGVVGLGVAAAGVDDSTQSQSVSEQPGSGPGDGPGQVGEGPDAGAEQGGGPGLPSWMTEWYVMFLAAVVTAVGVGAMVYYVWRDRLDAVRTLLAEASATLLGIAICLLVVAVVLWLSFDWSVWDPAGQPAGPDPGGGSADDVTPDSGVGIPPIAVLVGTLAIIAIAAVGLRRRRDEESEDASPARVDADVDADTDRPAEPTVDTVIGDEEPDNAVYRCWRDLATSVDMAREAQCTPGDVAEAAIDRGYPSGPVRRLTDVFTEVRYGHRPVTDTRRREATAALREIETGSDA